MEVFYKTCGKFLFITHLPPSHVAYDGRMASTLSFKFTNSQLL